MVLKSQSPYGAMWFATGEVVSASSVLREDMSQSPYGAKWFATGNQARHRRPRRLKSQSPYGAKWFATTLAFDPETHTYTLVAIPLRG